MEGSEKLERATLALCINHNNGGAVHPRLFRFMLSLFGTWELGLERTLCPPRHVTLLE